MGILARKNPRANGIDPNRMLARPIPAMDSGTERFTGKFGGQANQLESREYWKPLVVPDRV
jgi:hypothetical protein